ncbi:hypothetical protein [Nocardia sp. NPDC003345]
MRAEVPGAADRKSNPAPDPEAFPDLIRKREPPVYDSGTELFSHLETSEGSPAPEAGTDHRPVFMNAATGDRDADRGEDLGR